MIKTTVRTSSMSKTDLPQMSTPKKSNVISTTVRGKETTPDNFAWKKYGKAGAVNTKVR